MTKLYYRCPFEAAYMMNVHPIDLVNADDVPYSLTDLLELYANFGKRSHHIYVHKDSIDFFTPKPADIVLVNKMGTKTPMYVSQNSKISPTSPVIMRNGKSVIPPVRLA